MPCEKRCAFIRNKVVDEFNKDHSDPAAKRAELAFRYLQARAGEIKSSWSAAGHAFIPLYGWVAMAPIIRNARRYRKTKKMALQALIEDGQLSSQDLKVLRWTKYTSDASNLIKFFETRGMYAESEYLKHAKYGNRDCKKCNSCDKDSNNKGQRNTEAYSHEYRAQVRNWETKNRYYTKPNPKNDACILCVEGGLECSAVGWECGNCCRECDLSCPECRCPDLDCPDCSCPDCDGCDLDF